MKEVYTLFWLYVGTLFVSSVVVQTLGNAGGRLSSSALLIIAIRALKVNLHWLPTGPAMDVHLDVCKDLAYWQRLLDMMARNRFNTLSAIISPINSVLESACKPTGNWAIARSRNGPLSC